MIETLIAIILLPFAAIASLFTITFAFGAISWGFNNLFRRNK